ncbi:MAG: hypothetical protein ACLSDJ_11430, partial [Butyricimonas faecihominis]
MKIKKRRNKNRLFPTTLEIFFITLFFEFNNSSLPVGTEREIRKVVLAALLFYFTITVLSFISNCTSPVLP